MNQLDAPIAAMEEEILADEQKIEDMRRDLDAKRHALRMLIRVRDSQGGSTANVPDVQAPAPAHATEISGEIDLSALVGDVPSRRKTFTDDVRDVVARFGRQEFTNAHAEAAMKRLGVAVVGKTPRSRISIALAKLVESGFLVRTFIGGGNVPHRYRVRTSVDADELASYDAMNKHLGKHAPSIEDDAGPEEGHANVEKIA